MELIWKNSVRGEDWLSVPNLLVAFSTLMSSCAPMLSVDQMLCNTGRHDTEVHTDIRMRNALLT